MKPVAEKHFGVATCDRYEQDPSISRSLQCSEENLLYKLYDEELREVQVCFMVVELVGLLRETR